MTATQVFLRFVESMYKEPDGTIKAQIAKLWRYELRHNSVSSKQKYPFSYDWKKRPIRIISSKNFVDDFLIRNRCTLSGFMTHFLLYKCQFSLLYRYGPTQTLGTRRLGALWREFLNNHINEVQFFKKCWGENKQYTFTWKE